jgi:hypothetical protein
MQITRIANIIWNIGAGIGPWFAFEHFMPDFPWHDFTEALFYTSLLFVCGYWSVTCLKDAILNKW